MTNDLIPPAQDKKPPVKDVDPRESTMLGFEFAWDLGYTIAIPAVVMGFAGGYLDKYMHSSPLFLLLGLLIAFAASFTIVARKVRAIMARMPKSLPKKIKSDIEPEAAREQEALHDLFRPPTE
jgi:F0F1-type ATP synthase assembly protein I